MKKFRPFYPLGIAALAVLLLAFTSVAQAKPSKISPGDDNPGTETAYVSDGFFILANAGSSCAAASRICEDYANGIFTLALAGGDFDEFSYAWADYDLSCRSAARASAYGELFVFGGGELELNRHGKHGSMHHIEFGAGLLGSTAVWVDSRVHTNTLAVGEVFAIAGISGGDAACDSCSNASCTGGGDLGGRVLETCGMISGFNFGIGGGWAQAQGSADALATAEVGSLFGMGTWTGVWAANIELFRTVVAAGGSTYAMATTGAQADLMTEAFVGDFLATYIEACASAELDPVQPTNYAYIQLCADGGAVALALAYARAETFVQAQARAMAETEFSAIIPAVYYNASGTDDLIQIGAFGSGGASGHLATRCRVPTAPL